jgi:hypothetical protein
MSIAKFLAAADLAKVPSTLQSGDRVVFGPGVYSGLNRKFTSAATAAQPVVIEAAPLGGAVFSGRTKIELAGENMVFAGFRFEDGEVNGYALLFGRNSRNIRVSNCAFARFSGNPGGWLLVGD